MKKIIFLILSFSFIFAEKIVCTQTIKAKTNNNEITYYTKICIEGKEYISYWNSMSSTNKNCTCIPYKTREYFLGSKIIKYKFKEIK